MEKRTINIRNNNADCRQEGDSFVIGGMDGNYQTKSSDESTTEEEVEFEGWIEFVSKKDADNNKEKKKSEYRNESKLRDVSKKSSTNKISPNRNGKATLRYINSNSNANNKRTSKDKEKNDSIYRGDNKIKKPETIHAQIHAQIQSPASNQTQLPTQVSLPGQISIQPQVQTVTQAPIQYMQQQPVTQAAVQYIQQPVTQAPVQYIQQPATQAPVQYIQQQQQQSTPHATNIILQPNQQQAVQNIPTPQIQQVQSMQQIHAQQVPSQMQQVHINQVPQVQQQMQVTNGHLASTTFDDMSGPFMMEAIPPLVLNNEQNQSPVYIRQPPTVVVSNQPGPPIIINPPPANVILENQPPQPIYVNNPRPNIIMKNNAPNVQPPPNMDAVPMQTHNTSITADTFPTQMIIHRDASAAGGQMMRGGNINIVDNNNSNKNVFYLRNYSNGGAALVQNDSMQTKNVFIPRNNNMTPNVIMTDMGNNQTIHIQKKIPSCTQSLCSFVSPYASFPNDPYIISGDIYDNNFIHNAQHIDLPKEIRCNYTQQFIPPPMTHIVNDPHMVHMAYPSPMTHISHVGHPQQIIQETNPHIMYENTFLPYTNGVAMSHHNTIPMTVQTPTMPSMYMPTTIQPEPKVINTTGGYPAPATIMHNYRSPSMQLTPSMNCCRMNSSSIINPGNTQRGSFCSKVNVNGLGKKVEITAKPVHGHIMNARCR